MATQSTHSACRSSAAKHPTGRHRAERAGRAEAYKWLGAGAFTLGMGAAMVAGAGAAAADAGTSDSTSASSTAGPSTADSSGASEKARGPKGRAADESAESAAEAHDAPDNADDVAETAASRTDDEPAASEDSDRRVDDDAATSAVEGERNVATVTGVVPADPVAAEGPEPQPVDAAVPALPVAPVLGSESARRVNGTSEPASAALSRATAVPNTAPTLTVRSAGSPGMFSPNVYGRVQATDPDGDRLTFIGGSTALGKVSVNAFGAFTYTPTKAAQHGAAAPNGRKTDSIGITVDDGFGGVVTTYVTVTIKPANARPSGKATVNQPNPANGAVTGRIAGTDGDGDALGFTGSAATPRGNVVVNADGTFVYTPTAEALAGATSLFKRSDRFTVTVTDGHGGTSTVTVRVPIPRPGTNEAPQLGSPQFAISGVAESNGQVTGHISATDPEGFALTYRLNTGVDPGVGSVGVNAVGHFSFVPTVAAREAAYRSAGADTVQFSAVVTDGAATTVVVVTVPISAKAPAPPPPSTPSLNARVDAFVSATRGRTIAAPDGSLPGECVSLVKRFLRDVHGITPGNWGNAVEYRQGATGGKQLAARGFVWRTDNNLQTGDILVWGSGAGSAAGHIGIWHAGKLYDQNNYGSGRASAPRTANYSPYVPPGRLGYWRKA